MYNLLQYLALIDALPYLMRFVLLLSYTWLDLLKYQNRAC